jgi:hypothetical protein
MCAWGRAPATSGPSPTFPAYSQANSQLVAILAPHGRPLGSDRDRQDIHLKGEPSRFRWLRAPATTEIVLDTDDRDHSYGVIRVLCTEAPGSRATRSELHPGLEVLVLWDRI